ncbi:hypothetical protein PHJA_001729100 [Phtheirospermum japonicum]|uniref:Uncharacterized protein n=1 Tax=Phtheirospermum japonicum TaxID=374723 RepID=A0A830C990_9LAMI|nr:hypothetical protein PHJA_001729100 [Phtheirospermum japonicum]
MFEGKKKNTSGESISCISLFGSKKLNSSRISNSVMESKSDWTKHKKLSAFTTQEIHFATSFMPWSCRIPIGEGFHEFL